MKNKLKEEALNPKKKKFKWKKQQKLYGAESFQKS
jgi:hypothetical protein